LRIERVRPTRAAANRGGAFQGRASLRDFIDASPEDCFQITRGNAALLYGLAV
jgi:hypothetical protein